MVSGLNKQQQQQQQNWASEGTEVTHRRWTKEKPLVLGTDHLIGEEYGHKSRRVPLVLPVYRES